MEGNGETRTFAQRQKGLSAVGTVALGLVPIAFLLGVWWFVTRGAPEERILNISIAPSPAEVLDFVPKLFEQRGTGLSIWGHAAVSFRRVSLGFLIALAIVLPLGALMGATARGRALFAPIVTASGYIPIAALVPLTMSWFGIREGQKVYFLALAFVIYLAPLVVRAVDSVEDVYVRTAYTLGASRWDVIRRVLIPIAAPDVWHAMRLAFGIGWTYLVLVEVVVMDGGFGELIFLGQRRLEIRPQVYLVILLITLIAWVVDMVWARAGRLLFPYTRSKS